MVAHVLLLLDYHGRNRMVAHVLLLLDYSGRNRMVAHVLLLLDYSGHRGRHGSWIYNFLYNQLLSLLKL